MTDIQLPNASVARRITLGVAIPLMLLVLAFALWAVSDRLVRIGPFDRAAFGWIFVVPVWVAGAPAAGLAWAALTVRDRSLAATILAVVVSGAVALAYWLTAGPPACEFGSLWTPGAAAVRAAMLGFGVGIGPAVAGLLGAANGRGQTSRTVIVATIASVVMSLMALLLIGLVLTVPMCERPRVG